MLTLTRRVGEIINIGDDIQVTVKEIRRGHVRLGLLAPKALKIYRGEVYQAILKEQAQAPVIECGDEVHLRKVTIVPSARTSTAWRQVGEALREGAAPRRTRSRS